MERKKENIETIPEVKFIVWSAPCVIVMAFPLLVWLLCHTFLVSAFGVRMLSARSVFLERSSGFQLQDFEWQSDCACMVVPFKRPITIKVLTSLMFAQIEPSKEQQRPQRCRKKRAEKKTKSVPNRWRKCVVGWHFGSVTHEYLVSGVAPVVGYLCVLYGARGNTEKQCLFLWNYFCLAGRMR